MTKTREAVSDDREVMSEKIDCSFKMLVLVALLASPLLILLGLADHFVHFAVQ